MKPGRQVANSSDVRSIHTHTHTHTYTHTHTHTQEDVLKSLYIHTHTRTHIYVHTYTHTHAQGLKHVMANHTYQSRSRTLLQSIAAAEEALSMGQCVCVCVCVCIYIYIFKKYHKYLVIYG